MKKTKKKEDKPYRLNIACGQTCKEGWVGIDAVKCKGADPLRDSNGNIVQKFKDVDIAHDLNKYPWPFKDNSVDEIECFHYIEHIPHDIKGTRKDGFFCFFDEVYRILKPSAKALFVAPYYTSMRCWQDPTHLRAITDASFLYLDKNWRTINRLDHYEVKCDFEFFIGHAVNNPQIMGRSEETRNFAIRHYNNSVDDIHVTLKKR